MANPFDYMTRINKKEGIDPRENLNEFHGVYSQYLANRNFSYFVDTILSAQDMNIRGLPDYGIDDLTHFDYMNESIKKGVRYGKWDKPNKSDTIDLICSVYNYTVKKANEVIDLFTDEDIKQLKQKIYEGGRK